MATKATKATTAATDESEKPATNGAGAPPKSTTAATKPRARRSREPRSRPLRRPRRRARPPRPRPRRRAPRRRRARRRRPPPATRQEIDDEEVEAVDRRGRGRRRGRDGGGDRGRRHPDARTPHPTEDDEEAKPIPVRAAPHGRPRAARVRRRGRDPRLLGAITGATADPVKDYLKQIGKVALLNAAEEVELAMRIEAGLFAEGEALAHVEAEEKSPARPRAAVGRPRRPAREEPPARREPAPRGLARQALHRPRHAVPRPDPGGQPGPHPRGREVRLHQGLQVLDLRDVVDPPGDHARDGRPGPHHPHPGAHGRGHQQARPRAAPDAAGPGPRAHARGASRRNST